MGREDGICSSTCVRGEEGGVDAVTGITSVGESKFKLSTSTERARGSKVRWWENNGIRTWEWPAALAEVVAVVVPGHDAAGSESAVHRPTGRMESNGVERGGRVVAKAKTHGLSLLMGTDLLLL